MGEPIYYADTETSVQVMLEIIGKEVDNPKTGLYITDTEEWEALDPFC